MAKPIEEDLGADLRDMRKKSDVTMKAAADEMGISLTYLCDLERGKRTWSEGLVASFELAVAKLKKKKR